MTRAVRMYVRLAYSPTSPYGQRPFKLDAALKPNPQPLTVGSGRHERALHTVRFAVELHVDDAIFNPTDWPMVELELNAGLADKIPLEIVGQAGEPAEVEVAR